MKNNSRYVCALNTISYGGAGNEHWDFFGEVRMEGGYQFGTYVLRACV